MSLKHPRSNLLSLTLGIFLAFLVVAAPHAARAQVAGGADVCSEQGDFYQSYGHSMSNMAGRIVGIHKSYLHNSVTLDIDAYCIQAVINLIEEVQTFMAATDVKFLIISAVASFLLQAAINVACTMTEEIEQGIQALAHSLYLKICLPFPQLHLGLNLPKLPVPVCIGFGTPLGAVGLQQMNTPPNSPSAPNNWQIWGGANSKFQTYVAPGP